MTVSLTQAIARRADLAATVIDICPIEGANNGESATLDWGYA